MHVCHIGTVTSSFLIAVQHFSMKDAVIQRALNEAVIEMGLSSLKPKQTEAILAIVAGKDTFVSLPTGYGKSIIYRVLPLLFDKLRG